MCRTPSCVALAHRIDLGNRLFSNKSTQSPTGFSPNPYDCRGFGDSATPKTSIRLRGDFGGPMPTGLKGHQQLSSGCVAKPSERQSRPLGAAAQPVIIELSRERHHAPWRVERALALWDFWYSCWSLTYFQHRSRVTATASAADFLSRYPYESG